jgi:TrmH family RNA methyltransferase
LPEGGDRARPQGAGRARGLGSGSLRRGRREGEGRARSLITSPRNETLKLVRKLHARRWRDKLGLFVAEGEDLIDAALEAGVEPVELLVAGDTVEPELLAQVSTLPHPARVVGVFRREDLPASESRPVALSLLRIADPGNVGTLIRTADAFGASVELSAGTADPTGPKALRASAGALFRVPLGPAEGTRLGLVAHGGRQLSELQLGEPTVFVLGAERGGLSTEVQQTCDELVTIPTPGPAESLNVAAAGAIALYEWSRRRG